MRRVSAPFTAVSFAASVSFVTLVSFVLVCSPSEARAQTSDLVGVRARGMAGAFTAVADDATATWWNPAGLAGGAYFNAVLEYGRPRQPPHDPIRGMTVAFPALGLSYYRLPLGQIRPVTSTGVGSGNRQDEGDVGVYGATVGQSLGNHLVVGSTVKLVRAGESHGGLDVGALAAYGRVRVGLMVRNVRELEFGGGPEPLLLRRQARAGAAFTVGRRGSLGRATVAFDADLTKITTSRGDVRRAAIGGEGWTATRTIGVRGGVSLSTLGPRRPSPSAGVSVAVRRGMYLEAEITGGDAGDGRQSWGVALRLTF
jgi:hypothetical protein